MQGIEKIFKSDFWLTIIFVLAFVTIFLMSLTNRRNLKIHFFSIFKVPLLPVDFDEKLKYFNSYKILSFLFIIFSFSLTISIFFPQFYSYKQNEIKNFGFYFLVVLLYFLVKLILEYLLLKLIDIKDKLRLFIVSKWDYLLSISLYIYIILIVHFYSHLNFYFSFYLILFFLLLRTVFIVVTNKKLVFSKLFYFILYLCAFEIAPLFILFKSMF